MRSDYLAPLCWTNTCKYNLNCVSLRVAKMQITLSGERSHRAQNYSVRLLGSQDLVSIEDTITDRVAVISKFLPTPNAIERELLSQVINR